MAYLKMSPLVAISELHRYALRQGLSYQRGLFPGEPLTVASRDDQHPLYGIEMGSGRAVPAKGAAPVLVIVGALAPNGPPDPLPLPL